MGKDRFVHLSKYVARVIRRLRPISKRSRLWFFGIVAGGVTTALTATFTDITKLVTAGISEKICRLRHSPTADETRFAILVSPLAGDTNGLHTAKVIAAFRGERAFRVISICESLALDNSRDLEIAEKDALTHAATLIRRDNADLLLFGQVLLADNSIHVWAVNEAGGCEFHRKPIILKHGALPEEFDRSARRELIRFSIAEIARASCGEGLDWEAFGKRVNKLGMFLDRSIASMVAEDFGQVMTAYTDAIQLLYKNGWDDVWFSRALDLVQRLFLSALANDSKTVRSELWHSLAQLRQARFSHNKDPDDRLAMIRAYEEALHLAPDNSTILINAAESYLEAGEVDRAFLEYDKAFAMDQKNVAAFVGRAGAFAKKSDFPSALKDYSRALEIEPNNASTFLSRGRMFSNKLDYLNAIRDFDRAIELDSKNLSALICRAVAHVEKKEYDLALLDYEKALRIEPKSSMAFAGRGAVMVDKGDFAGAIRDFDRAIELNPRNSFAFDGRATAFASVGEVTRALRDYNSALKLDPNSIVGLRNRAVTFSNNGDFQEAIQDYDRAIRLDPKDAESYEGRAATLVEAGDIDRALQDYARAIALNPRYVAAFVGRGDAFAIRGEFEQAIASFDRAIQLDPKNGSAFQKRAGVFEFRRQFDAAIRDYNVAISIDPKNAEAINGRGRSFAATGDLQRARQDYAAAAQLNSIARPNLFGARLRTQREQ